MKRILSGMQPSGNPHLGNYLGAMRQHIKMQNEGECFFFIADYHALTTVRDKKRMTEMTLELAMDYLALGIDPKKTNFYLQSSIPEITELAWILSTVTPVGLLERAHAWKDSLQKGKKDPSVGLFIYPVLMAADILIMKPTSIPVGKDQKQHVEIARDIAQFFNNIYGETFPLPNPEILPDTAVIPGTDGEKMSKSYGNTIDIFAPTDELKQQVFSIKTDSKCVEDPKNPSACIPFLLLKYFADNDTITEIKNALIEGGLSYSAIKTKLFETLLEYFNTAREKKIELQSKKDYCYQVLNEGQSRAQAEARKTINEVREKTGLIKL